MQQSNLKPSILGVSFFQSIKGAFSNYVNFKGRSSRSEFWWYQLAYCVVFIILYSITVALAVQAAQDAFAAAYYGRSSSGSFVGVTIMTIIIWVFVLATLLPSLALMCRRLHDTGKSGLWILIGLVPFVGGIVLLVLCAQETEPYVNEYGSVAGRNYPLKPMPMVYQQAPQGYQQPQQGYQQPQQGYQQPQQGYQQPQQAYQQPQQAYQQPQQAYQPQPGYQPEATKPMQPAQPQAAPAYQPQPAQQPAPQYGNATSTCPNCGSPIPASSKFCPNCGTPATQQKFCPNCGNAIDGSTRFCPYCGAAAQ